MLLFVVNSMGKVMSKNIRSTRTNLQDDPMAALAIAQNLERRERTRVSTVKLARQRLADKLRIGAGALENIIRGRAKRIDAAIRDRLQALLIRELEAEIKRLQHELEIHRQCGMSLGGEQVSEVEAYLAKATALLKGHGNV